MAKYYIHIPAIPCYVPAFLDKLGVAIVLKYRKRRYGYAFRKIKLTQGKYAIVDVEDFEQLNQFHWYMSGTHCFYAYRSTKDMFGKRKTIAMHRQIMTPFGCNDNLFVDHINHNGLDNRKANLRLATPAENSRNRKKHRKSGSKYKGVTRNSKCKTWFASIGYENQQIYLGSFTNEIDAAKAYDKAAKMLFSDFASLNFPDESKIQK